MASLDDYFAPKSVAIVGASDDARRIGGRPLAYMIQQGFEGALYPVNPRRESVQGLRCYPSLLAIEGDLDFVLVAVPAKEVAEAIRQAIAKNAKTALILSAGFAEVDGSGAAMQAELSEMARASGLSIIGPNCLGLFNSANHFFPTFSATIDRAIPRPGGVAIASQSGAYGSHIYILSHMRGLGIGYWVTTGNEAGTHVSEFIQMFAGREDVHTIVAYIESVKDGALFAKALETARQNRKPVILMKVGRSAAGAEAAGAHTASLAGDDAVYDAVIRQHGGHRARTTGELIDIAYACRPRIYPAGKRLGIVSVSGGAGILIADAAHDYSIDVPPMPAEAQAEMKALLPFSSPRNPVDVTAQFFNDLALIPRFTRILLDKGGYDGIIGFWTSIAGSPVLGLPLLAHLRETMADYPGRLFLHCIAASDDIRQQYEEAGFPCFEDPSRAAAAMAALMAFGEQFAKGPVETPRLPAPVEFPPGAVSEHTAKMVLSQAGLPVLQHILAETPEAAIDAALKFGGAVAMKICSPDILHKMDVGGVILGVQGADAAQAAFERLVENARSCAPGARIEGVLVSPMINDGVECLLGAKTDPVFGPIVLFGLGGIFAEALNDVSLRCAPFGEETARSMIEELKGAGVLKGKRGRPPADLEALARTISHFSGFAAANAGALEHVEMNPLLALPSGCLALDALIVAGQSKPQKNHCRAQPSEAN